MPDNFIIHISKPNLKNMVDNIKIYFILEPMDKERINLLFKLPFMDLLYKAHNIHRQYFDPNAIQMSTLLSLKTGGCSED